MQYAVFYKSSELFTMQLLLLNLVALYVGLAVSKKYECGYHTFDKIYNGDYAALDEFPWIARLKYSFPNGTDAGYFCAGSLISKSHVLTAAHCILNLREQHALHLTGIRLGEYNTETIQDCVTVMGYRDCASKPQDFAIDHFFTHEYFSYIYNDIAIIKIRGIANFTDFVRPICLPYVNSFKTGHKFTVSGWGRTENDQKSTIKLKVNVPLVDFKSCYQKFITKNTILDRATHLCAGGSKGKDSCTGDSGGPLMSTYGDGKWKIVGITSSGNKCGKEGWPAIYSRVYNYLDWIKSHML